MLVTDNCGRGVVVPDREKVQRDSTLALEDLVQQSQLSEMAQTAHDRATGFCRGM